MDKEKFFKEVLLFLKIAPNKNNLSFLLTWSNSEKRAAGKPHGFNPLNTTFNLKSDTKQTVFNSHGVKNYSTFENGVIATAKTLSLNYYTSIVNFLRSGQAPEKAFNSPNIKAALNKWGTNFIGTKIVYAKTPVKNESQLYIYSIGLIVLLFLYFNRAKIKF